MAKLTKKEIVRRYAEKNPSMTVRQMASDLDMTPAGVHQIMWSLRKEGKEPVSTRTNKIKKTIDGWEMKVESSNPDLIDKLHKPTDLPSMKVTELQVEKLSEQLAKRMHALQMKVEEQIIIIQYLEKRLDEEKLKGSGTCH